MSLHKFASGLNLPRFSHQTPVKIERMQEMIERFETWLNLQGIHSGTRK